MKKIMFVHFRTGERDGVSLEIEKRAEVFRQLGNEVHFLTGFDPRYSKKSKDIHVVEEMDIKRRLPTFLRETFFDEKILDRTLAWLLYQSEEEKLYNQVVKVLKNVQPDIVFVHNLFCLAYHLPATTALLKAFDFHPTKVIAVNHDFWWERGYFKTARYPFLKTIIDNLPPKRDYIALHQVINSIAQEELLTHRGIESERIGDYFDFSKSVPPVDSYNSDFLQRFGISDNDIVVLHATRIVERKAIENAIFFVSYLQKLIKKTKDFNFKGKKITKNSKVYIVLPNFVDMDSEPYYRNLKFLAERLKVNLLWIGDGISLDRNVKEGVKRYSFWDTYTFADLITYTSYQEGFGNQLLEAFWAKKIPIMYEYPVFQTDIKGEGYKIVSLGSEMRRRGGFYMVGQDKIAKAAQEALSLLQDQKKYEEITETNFEIARQNHGYSLLKKNLQLMLQEL